MGNQTSTTNTSRSKTCKDCNGCSQGGTYYTTSFGLANRHNKSSTVKRRQTPVRRQSPVKRRPSSVKRRQSPVKRRQSPVKRRQSPVKRRQTQVRRVVKDNKNRKIGTRLSARDIFDRMGMASLGKTYNILQKDGTYKMKVLRLRNNGSPYFANNFGIPHMHYGKMCFGS